MELRQLSYFVAVAEERQFTRAAARVSVAQPAISAQIRRLEGELGEPLFHRDRRAISLTAAGEALLPHARAALAAAGRARDSVRSLSGMLSGRLRIGVSRPVDERLAKALGDFHRTYPAIEIALTEQHNEPLLEAVSSGDLDAAIVGLPGQPPREVATRVVASEPLALGVGRDHPLAHRKTIAVRQLRDEPMITLTEGSGLRRVLLAACREAGFTPRITAETSELGGLVELAAEGLGIAVAPRSALEAGGLAVVPIARPRLERRTALAWRHATLSPIGRAFIALAERHFAATRR